MKIVHGTLLREQPNKFRWKSNAVDGVLSSDGARLHTLHSDGSYVEWSVASGTPTRVVELPWDARYISLGFLLCNASLALLVNQQRVSVWELSSQTCLVARQGPGTLGIAKTDDDSLVCAGNLLFSTKTMQFERRVTLGNFLRWITPDKKFLLTWNPKNRVLSLLRMEDGVEKSAVTLSSALTNAMFSHDGSLLYVATVDAVTCYECTLNAGERGIGREIWRVLLPEPVQLFFRGMQLMVGIEHGLVALDARSGAVKRTYRVPLRRVFSHEDCDVFVCGVGRPFARGDFSTGVVDDVLPVEEGPIEGVCLSGSERFLAWNNGNSIAVMDRQEPACVSGWEALREVRQLQFLPDEKHLWTGDVLYDWRGENAVSVLSEVRLPEREKAVLSPDGECLAWLSNLYADDNQLRVHFERVSSGEILWETTLALPCAELGFSEDGKTLWCVYEARYALDCATGTLVEQRRDFRGIEEIAMDSWFLTKERGYGASGYLPTSTVRIYRLSDGALLHSFENVNEEVFSNEYFRCFSQRMILYWKPRDAVASLLLDGVLVAELRIDPLDSFCSAVFSKEKNEVFVGTALGKLYRFALT